MALTYLGLGANLGNKARNLHLAMERLSAEVGTIVLQSNFYSSEPWGFESKNSFLNAVIQVDTQLSPFDLLVATQKIEKELGRTEKTIQRYADRIIDIDILLYDELIMNDTALTIPHQLMTQRDFVMIPIAEIAPDLTHPILGKSMRALCSDLTQNFG